MCMYIYIIPLNNTSDGFEANIPKGVLLRRSVFFTDTDIQVVSCNV